jgi:ribosomal protein L40E
VSHLIERLNSSVAWRRAQRRSERAWSRVKAVSTCRECGERISPLASVCHRCGAGNPFKVAVSPQLLLTAAACEIVLVLLHLR